MSLAKTRADYSAAPVAASAAEVVPAEVVPAALVPAALVPAALVPAVASPLCARIPDELAGLRLDQALARLFPQFSRSRLSQWLKAGRVTVTGVATAASATVWGGESVSVLPETDSVQRAAAAQHLPLSIVHEDAAILVVDKPAGMVVHPGSGNLDGTLLNALLHHEPSLRSVPRAGIVHRLDKDTSGLLVVGKTVEAQIDLVRQMQAHAIRREYLALVHGTPVAQSPVHAPIGRHPTLRTRMAVVPTGRAAITHYRVLQAGSGWSLLECRLETGRTHQIRVHMQALGHPLIGDPVYRSRKAHAALPAAAQAFARQALHATRLMFLHPTSRSPLSWHSSLPPDLQHLLALLTAHAPAS